MSRQMELVFGSKENLTRLKKANIAGLRKRALTKSPAIVGRMRRGKVDNYIMIAVWIVIIWAVLMLLRVQWVYHQLMLLLDKESESIDKEAHKIFLEAVKENKEADYSNCDLKKRINRYWSFNKMTYHFWIWDIEKMKD